ncbi:MAG: aminoacetone oxidase family FAD-binding enzyme [Victivallales bacterium]|nr:aminoacetone oxidase family FAD-binding enzyme [Victivallales bacterium]
MNTDLVIIGAGAAGLFAACEAADAGLKAVLLERRHRAGLKLLMCGNNRCNLSHVGTADELLRAYGSPVRDFLAPAIRALPPSDLQRWFQSRLGLRTKILGNRIYPYSEKGDDVLHAFLDHLRDRDFPIAYSAPAEEVQRLDDGFLVRTPNFHLETRSLLLTIGGFSYPRTGSVGDGERFGKMLGVPFEEARAGLVGLELPPRHPLSQLSGSTDVQEVIVTVPSLPPVAGNLLVENGVLRGAAVFDLTRLAARHRLDDYSLSIDFFPHESLPQLERRLKAMLARTGSPRTAINALGLPPMVAEALAEDGVATAGQLKEYRPGKLYPRPLKEAIVTIGGFARSAFDPETMECHQLPGLHAAGEVLDIDGPTGGYNLHAAFATAQLAIRHLAGRTSRKGAAPEPRRRDDRPASRQGDPRKSAWGKHFWDGKRPTR